jgi:hypothetical protein
VPADLAADPEAVIRSVGKRGAVREPVAGEHGDGVRHGSFFLGRIEVGVDLAADARAQDREQVRHHVKDLTVGFYFLNATGAHKIKKGQL